MKVQTILYHSGSFWLSPHRYHSPRFAFEELRRDWVPLGSPGWYTTYAIQARYMAFTAIHPLRGWFGYDGEYELVDLEVPDAGRAALDDA